MEIVLRESKWREALVVPIGDLQLGAQGACPDKLRRHIEEALKHPNPLFLGMGDYTDFLSPSNRDRLSAAALYDSGEDVIERASQDLADRFVRLMRGTEGRWLGMLEGHHYYQMRSGITTDQYIADKLKAPFLGSCAYVGIRFMRSTPITNLYWIACHHGQGSGAKNAAPLNKIENWLPTIRGADLVLIGHYTRMPSTVADALYPTTAPKLEIRARPIRYACTGGWYQGYCQGARVGNVPRGSYVERGMMPAVTMGAPVYFIRPVHCGNGHDRIEVREMK